MIAETKPIEGLEGDAGAKRGKPGLSVQNKILLYVVPIVLASTLIVFGFFELNARSSAEQQLRTKLDKLVQIQSAVIAESLWNLFDEQIKLILEALHTDPDVLAAAVYDDRDRLVASVGELSQLTSTRFVANEDIIYDSGDQQSRIGELRVALTDTQLKALTNERLQLVIVLASILLAAIIGAILLANR